MSELGSTTEILLGDGTAGPPIHFPGQPCDVCDTATDEEIIEGLEAFARASKLCADGLSAATIWWLLPLPWPEFNRRAKAYFRQRVAERRHERNRRENTYSLRVKEMARIKEPR